MNRLALLILIALSVVGCATTQPRTAAQQAQQLQALQENGRNLESIETGFSTEEVRQRVGTPMSRSIFWESRTVQGESWLFASDAGYTTLQFRDGKLTDKKTLRNRAKWARDTSVPISQSDIAIHLVLSTVKLGATRGELYGQGIKPTHELTEQQTAEIFRAVKEIAEKFSNMPGMGGFDLSSLDRDNTGELWLFRGDRLGGRLLFRRNQVVEINLFETGTKAQQAEQMQQLF